MAQKVADGGWGVHSWSKHMEPLGHSWGSALSASLESHCMILNRRGMDSDVHISVFVVFRWQMHHRGAGWEVLGLGLGPQQRG